MSEENKKLEFPYLAVIPYDVMKDKKLTPQARLHFGCLAALSKKKGYSYASDEQLAEMHEVDKSQIKRWNKSLENRGHITRDTYNISYRDEKGKLLWRKERKIYVNCGFSKNNCEQRKNAPSVEQRKNAPYKEEIYKKEKQHPLTPSSKSETTEAKKKVVVSSKNIKERESSTLEKVKRKWIKEKRSTALIEEVFKRFKNTALDEIYNLEKWLEGTLVKVLEQQQKQSDMKELTEGRKKICEKRKGWYVLEKGVAIMSGAIENFYKFNGSEEFWEKHKLSREHFEEYKMSKKTNKQIKNPEENMFLVLSNRDKKG